MNLKKRINRIFVGAMLLTMVCGQACTHSEDYIPTGDYPICLEVTSIEGLQESRTLIGEDEGEVSLQAACTNAEAIAVWGNYTTDGTDYEAFANTPLTCSSNGVWSYAGGFRFWQDNSLYKFRACYPKNALGSNATATNANSVAITYDTEALQEDLLVAYTEVDSDQNQGKAVPLVMKHALATLKFNFIMEEGASMTRVLKSFSLGNTLKTSGTLVYDTPDVTLDNWQDYQSADGSIYAWQTEGLEFSETTTATAYTGTTHTTGTEYCSNEGHVFIIPQKCGSVPTFSCQIDAENFENIPLGTTTEFQPGKHYIYTIAVRRNIMDITLTIKAWNEQDSSYDIDF